MRPLRDWIDRTGLENIVWATDLDLTLLDGHDDPARVTAAPGLQDACAAIDRLTGGRFFIITGRELDYVDKIFPGAFFKASCEYHNMFRLDRGTVQELGPRPQWHLIDDKIGVIVAEHPGMTVQKKPFMRSFHYARAESLRDDNVKQRVAGALQTLLDRLHELTGQKIQNIDGGHIFDAGPHGRDKGKAYEAILAHAKAHRTAGTPLVPLYFGDSPGDLPAAAVARAHGGAFISVGADSRVRAVADFTLDNPAECRALLIDIAGTGKKP